MLIQDTNPIPVAPDQTKVRRGFLREDLFVAVHEQFMTETAAIADIVLPVTMFLEHDDSCLGGGIDISDSGRNSSSRRANAGATKSSSAPWRNRSARSTLAFA